MRNLTRCLIFVLLCTCSCTLISSLVHDDQVVAKLGKDKLYKSELEKFIPDLSSPQDSARIAQQYIESWATHILYMRVAQEQLSKAEMDLSEELESYRHALIKYRYEQRYIQDRMDTVITRNQLNDYYEGHLKDFVLTKPILKVRFVNLMKDSPNKDAIIKMMASDEYDVVQLADSLAKSTALKYFDSSDTWMDASELAKHFGINYLDMLSLLKDKAIKYEPEGQGDLYFAHVCDIIKSGNAPIEYCEETIRDRILSTRKHNLSKALEQDLLHNALESKQLVIYQE